MTRLTTAEKMATEAKILKVNARAAKRGFTGSFALAAERVEVVSSGPFPSIEVYWDCEITGEAPKYAGWTFAARIDRVGEAFTVASAPGAPTVDRSLVEVGVCDHCQTKRARKNTYVVISEQGQQMLVGSSCIKDFLGHEVGFVWLSEDAVGFERVSGSKPEVIYSTSEVLAAAVVATREWGFVPASADGYGLGSVPTKFRVGDLMHPEQVPAKERPAIEAVLAKVDRPEVAERVEEITQWLANQSDESGYMLNLKVLATEGVATYRHIGLLASAPQSYAKHLGWVAEKAAKAAKQVSEWIGTKDQKVEIDGVVESLIWVEGDYGTSGLVKVRTEQGLVKMFTTASWVDTVKEGDKVSMVVTVSKHEEYKGSRETMVRRPHRVTVTPAA